MRNRSFLGFSLCNQSTYRNYGRGEVTLITRGRGRGLLVTTRRSRDNSDFELKILPEIYIYIYNFEQDDVSKNQLNRFIKGTIFRYSRFQEKIVKLKIQDCKFISCEL